MILFHVNEKKRRIPQTQRVGLLLFAESRNKNPQRMWLPVQNLTEEIHPQWTTFQFHFDPIRQQNGAEMSAAYQNFRYCQENSVAIWNFHESDFLKVLLIIKN